MCGKESLIRGIIWYYILIMSKKDISKKILLAEDEVFLARTFEVMLEKEGYKVTKVTDGLQALEELEKKEYGLLMLDLIMPKMDGFDVLERLYEKQNTIPIIVISNLGQKEDFERVKSFGVKKFFIKSNTSIKDVIKVVKSMTKE